MDAFTIKFIEKLPKEIEERMSRELVEYESSHAIDVNYKRFSIVLEKEDGCIIAALNAYTAFSEIYVDDIWVEKAFRGKGYGTELLKALEDRFDGKGFNNINLVTSAFQAPDFYKKCGFTAEFVRHNVKNPKLTKTFFVKYFKDEVQTQGILKEVAICSSKMLFTN